MSLTANQSQVYKGTAAVTYGSGSGVSGSQLQGSATITYGGAPTGNTALVTGSSNYMKLPTTDPTNFDPSTSNVFVECWVYWNGANWTSPTLGTIYERDNVSVQDFGMYTSSGQLTAYMYTQNGTILRPIYNPVLTVQTWYHVAFGYNTVNQTAYVWVNGQVGTTASVSNPARYTGSSIFTSIGASPLNGVATVYWNGYIRDVRVFKGAVIPTTNFTPVAAPFGYGTAPYISGGSIVHSLYNQYFYPSWLNLPGTAGSYLALGTTHPTNFDTSATNFFVECWVYLKSIPSVGGTDYYIIQRGTGVYAAEDIGLRILQTGYAEFYSYGAGNTIAIPNSGVALSAGVWYHLAGSIVASTKTVYMFLNGTLKNSASMAGAPSTTRAAAGSNFYIGTPTIVSDWVPANINVQDLRVVQGGSVPTSTFTPGAAPFSLASPTYVASMGTTVLALATQYFQTGLTPNQPSIYKGTASVTYGGAPTSNTALSLPGTSGSYVDLGTIHPASFSLQTSNIFLESWVYFNNISSGVSMIAQHGIGAGQDWGLWVDASGNLHGFVRGASFIEAITSGGIGISTWYHVAFSFDSVAKTTRVHINGSLLTAATRASVTPNWSPTLPLWIGNYNNSYYLNGYITDVRIVKGGTVPTSSFTPVSAPFSMASPTYVANMGTTVLSLASQYFQSAFTSRAILPPVLVNPGTQILIQAGLNVTVAQTALQPLNGITWTFGPTGSGLAVTSSTDYALNLTTSSAVSQTLFTVTAKNKAGLTSVIQFTGLSSLYTMTFPFTFTNMSATGPSGPTSITYGTSTPGYGTSYVMTLGTSLRAGMQLWTVPLTRTYTVTLVGAGGGAGGVAAGKGASITATLSLTMGDVIVLLVGQKGTSATSNCPVVKGGAGGASYMYNSTTSTLLMVAGGGGGGGGGPIVTSGQADASVTTTAKAGDGGATSGAAGTGTNGGSGASPACTTGAGGGGGYTGNGTNGVNNGVAGFVDANGGTSFTNGGTGGTDTNEGTTYGGFGGGGAAGNHCGGGGGGYAGGGGGGLRTCSCGDCQTGGGGSSYCIVSISSSSVTNTGDGSITVT